MHKTYNTYSLHMHLQPMHAKQLDIVDGKVVQEEQEGRYGLLLLISLGV